MERNIKGCIICQLLMTSSFLNLFHAGFICKCEHKFDGLVTGPQCQETTRTFEGGLGTSYIWLQTLVAYERSVVQLEFTTFVPDGLLLYQGPLVEGSFLHDGLLN